MFARCARRQALSRLLKTSIWDKNIHSCSILRDVQQRYLEKLQKRAEEKGVSVDELKAATIKQKNKPTPLPEAQKLSSRIAEKRRSDASGKRDLQGIRKDNSPVKPLSEIMDVQKVLRAPHTAEQIGALWTAFHASRSSGTGRGCLSAVIPLSTYSTLTSVAAKYPNFILPLQRDSSPKHVEGGSEAQSAYEFYFMQWGFHPPPSLPSTSILDSPLPATASPSQHPITTVLFTPLLEYKTRQSFATPHLVLTHYTDLANSHTIALMRGELTPSSSGTGNYIISQQDAQMLAMGLQRFYLAETKSGENGNENDGERFRLLRLFNENPEEFKWEELLKYANPTTL